MIYKLFNEPTQSSCMRQILYNRGMKTKEAQDKWVNASFWGDLNSPFDFGKEKVETAVELMRLAVEHEAPLTVIVDSDADGFTSAAIFLNYMYDLYSYNQSKDKVIPKLKYILHSGKQHGFEDVIDQLLKDTETKFIVIPDAGTNDVDFMQQLVDAGKYILCMDQNSYQPLLYFIIP